ncbi:MAG: anion transporter [Sulfurimonas sp. RIFOXYD12_FULL_33_39]|uniref:SLC13 family permease n=1 Tax=unclassified Sulfurimonas TaxID=2623549 RepID=UPI0008C3F142|nr:MULTISPECIES: SLC13 family permease [unclassified Sulfurimonas]OHE10010.1 MAG: anion transporter [Sulfurimonas sp. RIFOXYD12_FULL_33_39]OHE14770.1 MAG: anion transporter [Sulfurimonas sp. RIFOXYD2_FULL_34_21]
MYIYKEDFKKIVIALLIGILVFMISLFFFNKLQSSLLASIAFLVTLWTNEGLPLGVVSLLPIILFPSFSILTTEQTSANYSHPIIFLFLGGFLIAIAVEKTNLHKYIANKMFLIFPSTPKGIIFSLAITSGILSSVLSNTTTTLLLISIALFISDDVRLKMRFALSIAYGASVGGILTPIGTPPNLILLGIMQSKGIEPIPFLQWVFMVAPLVFIMLFIVASLLSIGVKDIQISINSEKKPLSIEQKKVLFLIGAVVVLLLLNAPLKPYWSGLGLSETGILLGIGLLLFAPPFGILDWSSDKSKIPFRIMFLFGAGFSIAKAFSETLLADELASYLISITHLSPILIIFAVAMLVTFTTEITSNTALVSIMLPVIYAVSQQSGINATLIMMVATVCASYAFMLPIATPPNAIAMSSGAISIKDMAKYGFVLNLAGVFLIVFIAEFFWRGFF